MTQKMALKQLDGGGFTRGGGYKMAISTYEISKITRTNIAQYLPAFFFGYVLGFKQRMPITLIKKNDVIMITPILVFRKSCCR